MWSGWGTPIFLWELDHDDLMDLVMGRIVICVQFDIPAFVRLCNDQGIHMSWVTGKKSDELKGMSSILPGSPNARAVHVDFPDGMSECLMSGFFARAVSDLTPPRQLIEMILRMPQQIQKERAARKEHA